MEKISLAILGKENQKFKNTIISKLKDLDCDVSDIEYSNTFDTCYKLGEEVLTKKTHRGIVIDDYGSAPFMIIGKMKGSIVAQISDEHSAHMTSEHNGANVMVIGTKLASEETIIRMIEKYISEQFAAGRHLVRTDMLDEMLKKEKDVK